MGQNCSMKILVQPRFFFKENVRYPVWNCRDPISLIPGTRISLILRTQWQFSLILGTRIGSVKNALKKLVQSQTGLWSRRFLGGVGFLTTLGVGLFCPTLHVQLDHFLHQTPKLGIPTEMAQFLLKQRFLAVHHDFH